MGRGCARERGLVSEGRSFCQPSLSLDEPAHPQGGAPNDVRGAMHAADVGLALGALVLALALGDAKMYVCEAPAQHEPAAPRARGRGLAFATSVAVSARSITKGRAAIGTRTRGTETRR
jgi:hypothetical protein